MKGYLSDREIAAKWKVSERWVNQYIRQGCVPGVERFGKSWAVPENAEKPERKRPGVKEGKKSIYFFDVWLALANIKTEWRFDCLYEHLVESYPRLTLIRSRPVWNPNPGLPCLPERYRR